jgi:Ca2+-binding EF-hand superfamily protein
MLQLAFAIFLGFNEAATALMIGAEARNGHLAMDVFSSVLATNFLSRSPVDAALAAEALQYKQQFDLFDIDGNGEITARELSSSMKKINGKSLPEEVKSTINEVDGDRSGTINFSEFMTLLSRKMHETDTGEEIRESFRVYDADGNGYITGQEFYDFNNKLGLLDWCFFCFFVVKTPGFL